ncbi:hypothetical protein QTP86_008653 [Hemibagrus guttatus]|nr:hypothetical protein QTP86_008653 [Hemibagrus guttatus]
MNPRMLITSELLAFYRNLFKVWRLFRIQRAAATDSLYWLLKEPLIHGARLDIAGNALTQTLLTSGVITLGHLVDLAGPELNDADGAAACLRLRSTRTVAQLLQKWNLLRDRRHGDRDSQFVCLLDQAAE